MHLLSVKTWFTDTECSYHQMVMNSPLPLPKGNSDKIPNWASIIPSTKKYEVQLVIGQKNLQSVLLKSVLDLLRLRSHYSPIKGQDNVYPSICNKNDAKKPELSSTRYGEKLLVCIMHKNREAGNAFQPFWGPLFCRSVTTQKKNKFCNKVGT